jgi:outer membrane protein OmpA-like peptidoglycan-associated protein
MRLIASLAVIAGLILGSPAARSQQPSFVIFFQLWSAAIDDQAQDVIAKAADWVKSHHAKSVRVIGFADPTGSRKANILLSELRAQVVVDGLAAAGVAPDTLRQVGSGSVEFVGSAQEARRVEIRVGN